MELILEFLSKNGKVQKFERLSGQSFNIGRAYDNDIIVNDRYTSPHHLTLRIDNEAIWLEDRASLNGIRDTKNRALSSKTALGLNQTFVVGNQVLRIVDHTQNLQPTMKMTVFEYYIHRLDRWYWAVLSIALLGLFIGLEEYFFSFSEIVWPNKLSELMLIAAMPLAAATVLAVVTSLFQKEVRFFTSIIWISAILIMSIFSSFGISIINFNTGDGALYKLAKLFDLALFLMATVWIGAYLATHMSFKKITAFSVVITLCFITYDIMSEHAGDKVFTSPRQSISILPQSFLFTEAAQRQEWLENTSTLFAKASKEASELRDH